MYKYIIYIIYNILTYMKYIYLYMNEARNLWSLLTNERTIQIIRNNIRCIK